MSELNPKKFEKEWQEAFDDAEMDVNPIVWDKIEGKIASQSRFSWKNIIRWSILPIFLMIGLGVFVWYFPTAGKKQNIIFSEKANEKSDSSTQSILYQPSKEQANASTAKRNTNQKIGNPHTIQDKIFSNTDTGEPNIETQRHKVDFGKQKNKQHTPFVQIDAVVLADSVSNLNSSNVTQSQTLSKNYLLIDRLQEYQTKDAIEKLKRKDISFLSQISIPKQQFSEKQIEKTSSPKNWVSIQVGVAYYNPHWQANYQAYLHNYIQTHHVENVIIDDFFKTKSEKTQLVPSYQIGLVFGRKLNERWKIKSGILYQQWRNQYATNTYFTNYQDGTHYAFLANIISNQITNPNFVQAIQHHPDYQSGSLNYLELKKFNNQSEIALLSMAQFWSIPIQIGYTLPNAQLIRYTAWAGINANIFESHRSESELIENNVQNNQQNKGIFRGLTWDATIGLEMEYPYHSNWSVSFTPSYRKNIQSLVQSSYLKTNAELFNLEIGLKYKF